MFTGLYDTLSRSTNFLVKLQSVPSRRFGTRSYLFYRVYDGNKMLLRYAYPVKGNTTGFCRDLHQADIGSLVPLVLHGDST